MPVIATHNTNYNNLSGNRNREMEITTYYGKQYAAYLNIFRIIFAFCIPLVIFGFVKREKLISDTTYFRLSLLVVILGFLMVAWRLNDIYWRNNRNFDEYEWITPASTAGRWDYNRKNFAKKGVDIQGTDLMSASQCVGPACCTDPSLYANGKCWPTKQQAINATASETNKTTSVAYTADTCVAANKIFVTTGTGVESGAPTVSTCYADIGAARAAFKCTDAGKYLDVMTGKCNANPTDTTVTKITTNAESCIVGNGDFLNAEPSFQSTVLNAVAVGSGKLLVRSVPGAAYDINIQQSNSVPTTWTDIAAEAKDPNRCYKTVVDAKNDCYSAGHVWNLLVQATGGTGFLGLANNSNICTQRAPKA